MPQKRQDAKIHKTKIIKLISLVRFCDFVIWRQNNYFTERVQVIEIFNFAIPGYLLSRRS